MKTAFFATLIVVASTLSAKSLPGPCDNKCAALYKDTGCPIKNCVGFIMGGTCTSVSCSSTFQVPLKIQMYIGGKTIDITPQK
jgi:hypothetical protein